MEWSTLTSKRRSASSSAVIGEKRLSFNAAKQALRQVSATRSAQTGTSVPTQPRNFPLRRRTVTKTPRAELKYSPFATGASSELPLKAAHTAWRATPGSASPSRWSVAGTFRSTLALSVLSANKIATP
jgi:hypothetical protein